MTRAREAIERRFAADKLHTLEDAIDSLTPPPGGALARRMDRKGWNTRSTPALPVMSPTWSRPLRVRRVHERDPQSPSFRGSFMCPLGQVDEHIWRKRSPPYGRIPDMKQARGTAIVPAGATAAGTPSLAPFDLSDTCRRYATSTK
jgi:hypothetical protein